MWSTRGIIGVGLLVAGSAVAIACGANDSLAAGFDDGRAGGGDASAGSPADNNGSSGAAPGALAATDNGVILVHAAGSQSFRLCFGNMLDAQPQPDAKTMPEANVVGVEVGSAVRIAPLRSGKVGQIYIFDEPLIRVAYPPGTVNGLTCNQLLQGPLGMYSTTLGTLDEDLSQDVHLIVIKGCRGDNAIRKYSTAECGADWTSGPGNLSFTHSKLPGFQRQGDAILPTQIIHLSQPLQSAAAGRTLSVTFGEVGNDSSATPVATAPTLFGNPSPAEPTKLSYTPDDVPSYGKQGFRVSLDSQTMLDTTLADVQKLSAPDDVPPSYYSTASNYVLLLLGDPAPKGADGGPDTDQRRNLHLLAVPVIQPKPDGGADGGGDGG
jgi:hypothetical protein